jgi:hypothetical protein
LSKDVPRAAVREACRWLGPLNLDLLNGKGRIEDCGGNRFHAPLFIDDAHHQYLNDAEGGVFVSGCSELTPSHIRRVDETAGGRVVHFAIDPTDGSLRVAVVERDEPLRLFLGVTDETRAEFDLLACAAGPKNKIDGTRRSAFKYAAKLMRTSETNGCFE